LPDPLSRRTDRQFGRVVRRHAEDERAAPSRLRVRSARCSGASLCVLDPAFGGTSFWSTRREFCDTDSCASAGAT